MGQEKPYARPKKGGYGLIELKVQLLGHRAKVIAGTLDECPQWWNKYMRAKMLHHMIKIVQNTEKATIWKYGELRWTDFLFEKTSRFRERLEWTPSIQPRKALHNCIYPFIQLDARKEGSVVDNFHIRKKKVYRQARLGN